MYPLGYVPKFIQRYAAAAAHAAEKRMEQQVRDRVAQEAGFDSWSHMLVLARLASLRDSPLFKRPLVMGESDGQKGQAHP